MPFGLLNAPRAFIRLMTGVIRFFIGWFVVVYFNNNLVYSRNREEHVSHLRRGLWSLEKIYVPCKVWEMPILFKKHHILGLFSFQGCDIDQSKVEAIKTWLDPKSIFDWRSFHGFASFCRWFVMNFITVMALITESRHANWVEFLQSFFFVSNINLAILML